jgi:trehalose-6-phosphate synthase
MNRIAALIEALARKIPVEDREEVNAHLLKEYQCYPVYLSDELADRHYNGFSNSILWPLFHYHPGEMNFVETHWLAYRQVGDPYTGGGLEADLLSKL